MDAITLLREQMTSAHQSLEGTMAGVTPEQLHWAPAGRANPIGASYAHVITGEDLVINGMLRQTPPMFAASWAHKTGMSEPMPGRIGPAWDDYAAWTRRVRIDVPALRAYAQAVYANTDAYLAALTAEDLDQPLDMSALGLGQVNLAWGLSNLVMGHVHDLMGEISCLKGLQGARGYPF